jgi:hypothetical protein
MSNSIRQAVKWLLTLVLAGFLSTFIVAYGVWMGKNIPKSPATLKVQSIAPTVVQLQRLAELTTARIHVTDVLFAEGEGYRGSWLINGDALLSCDISKARVENVDTMTRTATIRLPPLRVISARVNHDKTKTWSVEKTTWLPWQWGDQGVMRDAAMFHAQQLIESAAISEHNLTQSRAHAALLVRQIYGFVDWNVDVLWE